MAGDLADVSPSTGVACFLPQSVSAGSLRMDTTPARRHANPFAMVSSGGLLYGDPGLLAGRVAGDPPATEARRSSGSASVEPQSHT